MIPEIRINNIGVGNVGIGDVGINDVQPIGVRSPQTIRVADSRIWVVNPPSVQQMDPPVVVQVGTPIVDSGVDVGDPPTPPTPQTPEPPKTPTETAEDPPCPGPMAPRIGDVAQNMKEKVSGFELQRDPRNPDGVKICVTLYEDIGAVEAFLPAPQLVTTTAVIATVATGSALLAKPLADLLLRVVKPAVKKAIGAIQKKLGKTPYVPTQSELRTNEYRVKKGLLGINFAKQHSQREKAKKKAEDEKKSPKN